MNKLSKMSSTSYEHRTRGLPYVHKINLGNNNRRIRKNPPKLCADCKETNECIKLISNRVNRIEEIVNNFHKNLQKRENKRFSAFNTKFTLNNIPCELEYDLSNLNLENLQKLVIFTTQNCTPNNKNDK